MPDDAAPHLSLVIPAFNEAARLPQCMRAIAGFGASFACSFEALVVVEKSTDGTLELAREAAAGRPEFRVIDNEVHRGKGYAVRSGMLRARGAHVLYMDADLSVPLDDVVVFMDHFRAHPEVDVLIGNRQHPESRIIKRQSALRQQMGRTFNRVIQSLSLLKVRDTQCGFKAFRREAARRVFSRQRIDGFAFDVEVLLLAAGLGYEVVDLPVRWVNSPESKVGMIRDSARMLVDAVRVRRLVDRTLRERPPYADF